MDTKQQIINILNKNTLENTIAGVKLSYAEDVDISHEFALYCDDSDAFIGKRTGGEIKENNYSFGIVRVVPNGDEPANVLLSARDYQYVEGDVYQLTILIHIKDFYRDIMKELISQSVAWEVFSVKFKGDLTKCIINTSIDLGGRTHEIIDWEYGNILYDYPELFKEYVEAKHRVAKKTMAHYALKPLPTPKIVDNYHEYGYIPVDKDTNFCGNYNINGKQCCEVWICAGELWNPAEEFKTLIGKIDNSISPKDQEAKIEQSIDYFNGKMIEEAPYEVHLSGNDDYSLSKGFWTMEDAEKEVQYLMTIQPINSEIDLTSRGYYFSN